VQDCQWLQKLMSLGFLRAAWRPEGDVCVVRAVARQREVLITEQASWVQRMQKALVQMNIQLTEVLTDVMGMTGQAIIRAIVAGERDPKVLARHRDRRVKASAEEITKALTGNWRDEHLFVLRQALAMYDDIARHLTECDAKLQPLLTRTRAAQDRSGQGAARGQQGAPGIRRPPDPGQLGRRGPHAHQRARLDGGDEDPHRDRPRPESLRHRQALLFVAGPVPGHQDQRRQGALRQDQALGQPGTPGAEDGGDEPVAQRLCARRVLPPPVQPHGQAAAPTPPQRTSSHAWCTSCSRAAKTSSTRDSSATKNSSASAASPPSSAAPPRSASTSSRQARLGR
jgi:hypothetical protein